MTANKYILLGVLITCLCLPANPLCARTFTNQVGKKIDAEIVSVKGDKVTIKMTNGKVFTLAIATLSKADQEYIRSYNTPSSPSIAKPDERIKPGATVKLDFPNLTPDRKDKRGPIS